MLSDTEEILGVSTCLESYCLARQPICDDDANVTAYELLYRNNITTTTASVSSPHEATARVITLAFMDIGIERLAGHLPVFVNMTDELLLKADLLPEPAERVVLEVLEDIPPAPEILLALKKLKKLGYKIALDDFVLNQKSRGFLPYADIIKLDVMACSEEILRKRVTILKRLPDITLLAEKVETWQEFEHCKAMGFDLFQGYFLSRPETLNKRAKSENTLLLTRLLSELYQPEPDISELEKLISRDPQLYYRILKYINSAQYALPRKIESLRHAINLLGFNQLRSLVSMIILAGSNKRAPALIPIALIRARMSQNLAIAQGFKPQEVFFTVGLLSMLDVFFQQPMEAIMAELPLHDDIKQALLHYAGIAGTVLHAVITYEQGIWDDISHHPFGQATLAESYINAVIWADEISGQASLN